MSTTSGSNDSASTNSESPKQADSTSWVIDVEAEDKKASDVNITIEPLSGTLPRDAPLWLDYTEPNVDARGLRPFTVRLRSTERPSTMISPVYQLEVRSALLREMDQLLRREPDALPTITFDEYLAEDGQRCGVIDMVFNGRAAFTEGQAHLKNLDLHFQRIGGSDISYAYATCTNTLHGGIFVLECLRLPVDATNAKAVHNALTAICAPIGIVLGIGNVMTHSYGRKFSNETLRVYVELHQASLALPWQLMVCQLPTHIKWQGYPYTLNYPGRVFHKNTVFSANFPIAAERNGATDAEAGGSSSKRTGATNGAAASAETHTKKKRRSE